MSSFVAPKLEHRVLVGDRHLYPLTLTRAGSHLQCILSRVKTILTISRDDGRNGNDRVCIEAIAKRNRLYFACELKRNRFFKIDSVKRTFLTEFWKKSFSYLLNHYTSLRVFYYYDLFLHLLKIGQV